MLNNQEIIESYKEIIKSYLKTRDKALEDIAQRIKELKSGIQLKEDSVLKNIVFPKESGVISFIRNGSISDPTYNSVIAYEKFKDLIDEEINYRKHLINYYYCLTIMYHKIDSAFNILTLEERNVIQKYYFQNEKIASILSEAHIGAGKFYRLHDGAIDKIITHIKCELFDEIIIKHRGDRLL